MGPWNEDDFKLINDYGNEIHAGTGEPPNKYCQPTGNDASIFRTIPQGTEKFDEIYYFSVK